MHRLAEGKEMKETTVDAIEKTDNTNTVPAICTEPSSPRRIFPAFRSLCEEEEDLNIQTIKM